MLIFFVKKHRLWLEKTWMTLRMRWTREWIMLREKMVYDGLWYSLLEGNRLKDMRKWDWMKYSRVGSRKENPVTKNCKRIHKRLRFTLATPNTKTIGRTVHVRFSNNKQQPTNFRSDVTFNGSVASYMLCFEYVLSTRGGSNKGLFQMAAKSLKNEG